VSAEVAVTSGVAGRYASALFDLARDAGLLDRVMTQLDTFAKAIDGSPDLARLVRSPVFTADDQAKALGAVLPKMGITGIAANMLNLLAANRRLFMAGDVVKAFAGLLAAHRGAATAEVTSATPLTPAQMDKLAASLKAKTGKDIALDAKVDPSLIGGLVVKMGSRMIDTSLKTKLSQLKVALKEVR
jgi:F-type H+-transporting ATPase subunit delta